MLYEKLVERAINQFSLPSETVRLHILLKILVILISSDTRSHPESEAFIRSKSKRFSYSSFLIVGDCIIIRSVVADFLKKYRRIEKFGLSHQIHILKIVGSNPTSAITTLLFGEI